MSRFQAARSTIEALFNASPREDSAAEAGYELPAPTKRLILGLMVALVLYVIVRGVAAAATKPFWFDELITLTLSSLPSMKETLGALSRALDSPPPGFYVVQRNVVGLLHNKEIALRLASILAFPCTLVCVFVYVKRRSGEAIGLICALLLLLTSLFHRFAVEGRPYSMMIACFAFALVCYQRVPSPIWAALLGLILALAQALHYYSIFAMVPFGLAEAVFFLRTHKLRWQVWLALVFGVVPLAFFWPLLANIRTHFGAHFFEHFSLFSLPAIYGSFFLTDSAFGASVVAVSIAGITGSRLFPRPNASLPKRISDEDAVEGTLLLSFVLLPLIVFLIARVTHGGLRDAYVLASILGIALALAGALSMARPRVVALFALFVITSVGVREFNFWRANHSLRLASPAAALEEFVQSSGHGDLPVVVSSGMAYTPLAHYASPAFFKQLFYLMDEEKELHYQGTDTFDKNVVILRDYMPLQVRDFSEFTSAHRVFLLYGEEPGDGFNWLPQHLSRLASSVRSVAVEPSRRLYLVTMKEETSR
jgi:hypothetical protein